jgi:hypothetical protein
VFERSAEQAGYFEHGKNRLVMPAVAQREPPKAENPEGDKKPNGFGGGGGEPPAIDPSASLVGIT